MRRINPKVTWLSRSHLSSEFNRPVPLSSKVELFRERLLGWQLDIADTCANGSPDRPGIPHAGFAVLHLCLSYFETIGKYEAGYCQDGGSKRHFELGLRSVFPSLRRVRPDLVKKRASLLYEAGRCGLYHASQAGKGILLADQQTAIRFTPKRGTVVIDTFRLPVQLKKHLEGYCRRVLSGRNKRLQQQFEQRFNYDNPSLA